MLSFMTSHAPLIGGPSFLARDPEDAHSSFEDAHETLDVAEGEIHRLSAIIQAMPDTDKETHRMLRVCSEHVMHDGKHTMTDAEVDELRLWYFNERRTR
jgi:hypothetical protein